MTSVIEIQQIKFKYPNSNIQLLRGVDLEVKKNELVCIVGKIGGGKSTLLQHMNASLRSEEGDVIINGRSVKDEPKYPFHQEVGLLFENPDDQIFYPIVADDIAFGPRNLKLKPSEVNKRVTQAATEVDILHLLERDTATLSYGEKTLVALAGILAMKCKIILMDSPELGLDLWSKPKILDLIKRLSHDHTIIMTTNDRDILKIADKIYLLWNGVIRDDFISYEEFKSALSIKNA